MDEGAEKQIMDMAQALGLTDIAIRRQTSPYGWARHIIECTCGWRIEMAVIDNTTESCADQLEEARRLSLLHARAGA